MKHIIIVGDSFSDENKHVDVYDYNDLKKPTLNNLLNAGTLKPGTLVCLDIINQNKQKGITLHILGKGSAGNHYISEKLFDKVNEIRSSNKNDEIYAIIQLSAFFRNGPDLKDNIKHIDIEKYPFDYYNQNQILNFDDLSKNFNKHLDNIEEIDNFCKKNNVKKLIFFGWSVIYDDDIKTFELEKRINNIKNIVTFFPYGDTYDEMESYCAGNKPIKKTIDEKNLYLVKGNSFGGMTDFIRKFVPVGERYIMSRDPHLSSKSNVVFYNSIIKPWLIDNDLIGDAKLDNLTDTFELIYSIEKLKYDIFFGIPIQYHDKIRELIFQLLKENTRDLNVYEDKFRELMRELVSKRYLY